MLIPPKNKPGWMSLLFMRRGHIIHEIWRPLLALMLMSTLVTYTHLHLGWFEVNLTPLPFTLIGLSLSIFLGFRNNTSYERFWEGRKLWGQLTNTCRSLAREILTLIDCEHHVQRLELVAFQKKMVYLLMAFPHCLRLHLRQEKDIDELRSFLDLPQVLQLEKSTNSPNKLLFWLSQELWQAYRQGRIHPYHYPVLEQRLVDLTDVLGGCDRIRQTPIPYNYIVLLHITSAVYCFALPFGLVDTVGLLTPVVVFMVAYAFLGLDAIGDSIENPFLYEPSDLPLGFMARNIEINLREMLGESDLPPPIVPVDEDGTIILH